MILDDRMDDCLWDEVWERNLAHVERHNIAKSVWQRVPPDDPFKNIVGYELAHRWRARARNLAILYGVWSFFWALMTYALVTREVSELGLTLTMTSIGLFAVSLCMAFRARMRPIVTGRAGFVSGGRNLQFPVE